jgi:hypothetical protein
MKYVIIGGIAFLLFCAALCMLILTVEKHQQTEGFNAWVKLTGNEKNLTQEEWEALLRNRALPSKCSCPVETHNGLD